MLDKLKQTLKQMDKKKLITLGILVAVIFVIGIAAGIGISSIKRGRQDTMGNVATPEDAINNGIVNENSKSDLNFDSKLPTDLAYSKKDESAVAEFAKTNTWESNGKKFAQIDVTVKNVGAGKITDWTMQFTLGANSSIEQSWNCVLETNKNGDVLEIKMKPVDYNKNIEVGAGTQGIGFIFCADTDVNVGKYSIEATVDGVTVVADGGEDNKGDESVSDNSNENAEGNPNGQNNNLNVNNNQNNSQNVNQNNSQNNSQNEENGSNNDYSYDNSSNGGNNHYTGTVSGRLHVEGTSLVDSSGNSVQLRGVSTHGLAWFPQYVNYEAFQTLRDDWGVNVVRLAMYTAEYGGYCSGGDREALKSLVDSGVSYATQLGLYVIIDWHILSDGNPYQHKDEAVAFFSEMSARYAGNDNVIYEICNEPQNSDWNSVIKPYAEEVLSAIRSNTDALVIVGTNTWSQDVDAVIGNQIDDSNVCYALHFYAATHTDYIRNKLSSAMDNGVPVFVSECSICDASGNGGIDYGSADAWLDLLNSRGVSFLAWSLCNKGETSALINSGCDKTSGWNESDLSDTGRWFRNAIRNS